MGKSIVFILGILTGLTCMTACESDAEASPPTSRPATTSRPTSPPESAGLAQQVAAAHGGLGVAKGNLQARIRIEQGGKVVLAGTMTMEPASARTRIDLQDGGTLVFDGVDAWVSPPELKLPQARFHLRTWPYFLSAPWKLCDPGVTMTSGPKRKLKGVEYDTGKVTFASGVGDTPDDWYVVYCDPKSHQLKALAYIVTYGSSVEKANAEPHVAVYEECTAVDGLDIPSKLTFWNWNEEEGLTGESIGNASFDSIQFVAAAAEAFTRPANARKDELPK